MKNEHRSVKNKLYSLKRWKDYMNMKTVCLRISAPCSNEEMPIEVDRYY